jgi:hypothetical protein
MGECALEVPGTLAAGMQDWGGFAGDGAWHRGRWYALEAELLIKLESC